MVTPVECAGVVSWFESVNWGVLGAWAGAATTMAGVIFARRALTTWKKQIRLQDRYQKADARLISYRKCPMARLAGCAHAVPHGLAPGSRAIGSGAWRWAFHPSRHNARVSLEGRNCAPSERELRLVHGRNEQNNGRRSQLDHFLTRRGDLIHNWLFPSSQRI
jgi:hypothetical protein